jgi:hypothetical protein
MMVMVVVMIIMVVVMVVMVMVMVMIVMMVMVVMIIFGDDQRLFFRRSSIAAALVLGAENLLGVRNGIQQLGEGPGRLQDIDLVDRRRSGCLSAAEESER